MKSELLINFAENLSVQNYIKSLYIQRYFQKRLEKTIGVNVWTYGIKSHSPAYTLYVWSLMPFRETSFRL
jgi:hypothetical protein